MKLSEIHARPVTEDEDGPKVGDANGLVEVSEVVKGRNPEIAKKYLRAMWGKHRLAYMGKPFFGSGDTIYEILDAAVDAYIKGGFEVDVSISVEDPTDLGMDELNYKATIDDSQEVYLGYDAKSNKLFVGVDAWLREEDFNEAWDREFENETGEEYDEENEVHAAMFHSAWEEYKNMGFYGVLFEASFDGDDFELEPVLEADGGFYKGIYRDGRFKPYGLIDLRLD